MRRARRGLGRGRGLGHGERRAVRQGRRRAVLVLALAASLLGLAGLPVAGAQSDEQRTGEDLFGAYNLAARATGLQVSYNIEDFLPVSPLVDLALPESQARLSGGPSGYGLASLAFPGPLLGDLGAVLSLAAGEDIPIPSYPVRAEAFYPSGPTSAEQFLAEGSAMRTTTTDTGTTTVARYSGVDVAPLVKIGSITSSTSTTIEDGQAVSRARTTFAGVDILGGLISISGIDSEVVAVSDGSTAITDGRTTIGGVTFLGLAARITEEGLVLDEAPPTSGPAGPLGSLLGDLVGPLAQLTAPLRDLLQQALAQATPVVNSLLEAAGLELSLLEPMASETEGVATRSTSGLRIDFSYLGREQDALVSLLEALPPELRASLGPVPNPVNMLVENHIAAITLGAASVTVQANEKFTFEAPPFEPPPATGGSVTPVDPGSSGLTPSFDSPVPELPAPGPGDGTGPGTSSPIAAVASAAIPAAAVLALLLLGTPLFAVGSRRLANHVLAPAATSCPAGLDRPPTDPRS